MKVHKVTGCYGGREVDWVVKGAEKDGWWRVTGLVDDGREVVGGG